MVQEALHSGGRRTQAVVSFAPLHGSLSGEPVNLTYPVASYPIAHESIQLASQNTHRAAAAAAEQQWILLNESLVIRGK